MAFTANTFLPASGMANSNSTKLWVYATPDAKATVVAASYFDGAVSYGLQAQDVIMCVCSNGGTETLEMVFVDAISAAGVVTTLSSTLALT